MYLDFSRLLSLCYRAFALGILGLVIYKEWIAALYGLDYIAHWAHIGGALGATLYMFWYKPHYREVDEEVAEKDIGFKKGE